MSLNLRLRPGSTAKVVMVWFKSFVRPYNFSHVCVYIKVSVAIDTIYGVVRCVDLAVCVCCPYKSRRGCERVCACVV